MVSIIRDGGSFSVRRVTAQQNGRTIFILSASFHKKEEGYNHQIQMIPGLKQPEDLLNWEDILNQFGNAMPKYVKTLFEISRPVEFKPTLIIDPRDRKDLPPSSEVWFKLKGDASNLNLAIKQQILTYISDYNILASALNTHGSKAHWGNTRTASLDHSMWNLQMHQMQEVLQGGIFFLETANL